MIFKKNEEKKYSLSWFVKEIRSWILLIFLLLSFKSTFFDMNTIPSTSLVPTILVGDRVIISKLAYGIKIPLSEYFSFWFKDKNKKSSIWKPYYVFGQKLPSRGDIIVFDFPKDISLNYIKRVVGLPGDRIKIDGSDVYLNGKKLSKKRLSLNERLRGSIPSVNSRNFYRQEIEDKIFVVTYKNTIKKGNRRKFKEIVVPPGNVFVLGDNRDESADSRSWGFVPLENIKGKAKFVLLNFTVGRSFSFRYWRSGAAL